jgi:hypothetical protein
MAYDPDAAKQRERLAERERIEREIYILWQKLNRI